MAPSVFPEKEFAKILNDNNEHGYIFIERIRERGWYRLVYDNIDVDIFYCPGLVK